MFLREQQKTIKMNLFFLHHLPHICAQYHCDKHVVKMILELCQLMYTAHRVNGSVLPENSYRMFNHKHPTAIWVRKSLENYTYTVELCKYLCLEYTYRYNKIHSCQEHCEWLLQNIPSFEVQDDYTPSTVLATNKNLKLTPQPLAMYDDVKGPDTIQSYRQYYNVHKKRFATWTGRTVPWWFSKVSLENFFNGNQLQLDN